MTTWKSAIMDDHGWDGVEADPEAFDRYERWLEQVMDEPWVRGLEDLVKWSGVWFGTEQQIIEELKLRAGKEVSSSPDFPASFEQLERYLSIALDGFLQRNLILLHYRDLTEEDLDDFDVPGWGPEAPVLLHEGDAATRPDYLKVQFELLKYWHPLPVAIFHLTASSEFATSRRRTYTTMDLAKALLNYYPTYRNVRRVTLDAARPEGVDQLDPPFGSYEEGSAMLEPYGLKQHLIFHNQMKKWTPILKEKARIKVSWEKRATLPGSGFKFDGPPKTFWTIEAPRWKNPDRFRGTWAIFSHDHFNSY
jgi:hypothetical protein